jgi:hypothetical protein
MGDPARGALSTVSVVWTYRSHRSYKARRAVACEGGSHPLHGSRVLFFPWHMSAPLNKLSLDSLGPLDWYRMIRDQIQHEDNLIVQRLAWLMAAQSFFFTGYAIIANGTPTPRNQLLAKQQDLLFNIIPAVACLSDLLIYGSVIAGIIALYRLRQTYSQHVAPGDFIPAIQGSGLTRWLGIASPLLLPLVFLTAWLWLWLQAHR